MEPLEVRATLHPDRIRLERIEHEEVVAAVVAPCTSQSIEVTRGSSPLNVHCWTTIDGNPDGPSLRLAMDQDGRDGTCGSDEDSWGPTWSPDGCPMNDPGVKTTIFGRTRGSGDNENFGARNLGFGYVTRLNGNGFEIIRKNIQMYVR